MKKLTEMMEILEFDRPMPASARPHVLKGNWLGYWECHIAPDWLLIYKVLGTDVILFRTGTHNDLFE